MDKADFFKYQWIDILPPKLTKNQQISVYKSICYFLNLKPLFSILLYIQPFCASFTNKGTFCFKYFSIASAFF